MHTVTRLLRFVEKGQRRAREQGKNSPPQKKKGRQRRKRRPIQIRIDQTRTQKKRVPQPCRKEKNRSPLRKKSATRRWEKENRKNSPLSVAGGVLMGKGHNPVRSCGPARAKLQKKKGRADA